MVRGPTIEVNLIAWQKLRYALTRMQDKTFYCEDEDGFLRRWYPPSVPDMEAQTDE